MDYDNPLWFFGASGKFAQLQERMMTCLVHVTTESSGKTKSVFSEENIFTLRTNMGSLQSLVTGEICMNADNTRTRAIEEEIQKRKEENRKLREEYKNYTPGSQVAPNSSEYERREKELTQEHEQINKETRKYQQRSRQLQRELEELKKEVENKKSRS